MNGRAIALAAALVAFVVSPATAIDCPRGVVLSGVARAVDGDTLDLEGGPRIRLQGLHAEELETRLGDEAARFMRQLVDGRKVRCELDGTKTRRRCVAVCELHGEDVARLLVIAGLGWSCDRFSTRYRDFENAPRPAYMPRYCRPR